MKKSSFLKSYNKSFRKKTNKKRLTRLLGSRRNQRLAFIFIFAVFGGGILLWRLFALNARPTAPDEVVMEYRQNQPTSVARSGSEITYSSQPIGFRLMGDGTMYCDNTATPKKVKKIKLTSKKTNDLYSKAKQTGIESQPNLLGTTAAKAQLGTFDSVLLGGTQKAKYILIDNKGAYTASVNQFIQLGKDACKPNGEIIDYGDVPYGRLPKLSSNESSLLKALANLVTPKVSANAFTYGAENDQYNRINQDRARIGRNQLFRSDCLTRAARSYAQYMGDNGYFGHSSTIYGDLNLVRSGANCGDQGWQRLGENIGRITADPNNPVPASAAMFGTTTDIANNNYTTFLGSCTHRGQIESFSYTAAPNGHDCATMGGPNSAPYDRVGVGAYVGRDNQLYIVQLFAYCPGCGGPWSVAANVPSDSPSTTSPTPPPTTASGPVLNCGWYDTNCLYDTKHAKIALIYQTLFYRMPDKGGMDFWNSQGGSIEDIGASIMASSEPAAPAVRTASTDNLINHVYNVLLGRPADFGGLNYWRGVLGGSPSSQQRISFIMNIAYSSETRTRLGETVANHIRALYPPPAASSPTRLTPGQALQKGQQLRSPNSAYHLDMQHDGSLALYPTGSNVAIWHSNTYNTGLNAVFQGDGNFVVNKNTGGACHSASYGKGAVSLDLQDDGNLVIYASNGTAVWSSRYSPWHC